MDEKSKRFLLIFVPLLIVIGVSVTNSLQKDPTAKKVTAKYVSVEINDKTLKAEIAKTPQQKKTGLSNRKSLPKDEGMLFYLSSRKVATFWMKDMLFPIDIIWIDNEKIVYIIEDAQPPSATNVPSFTPDKPATHVLEVNVGFVKKYTVEVGDRITISTN